VLFALAGFVLVDWPRRKREILLAGVLLGIVIVPCLVLSHGTFPSAFPKDYVEAILLRNPEHFTLQRPIVVDLLHWSVMILVAACMILLVTKLGIPRYRRLELLSGFFLLPFVLGALVGGFFPTPSLIRLHLLRSESFLLLYSILLIQIYGGGILLSPDSGFPPATRALCVSRPPLPL